MLDKIKDLVVFPDLYELSGDVGYKKGQIGAHFLEDNDPETADVVLLSCDEWRGSGQKVKTGNDWQVRHQLYNLYLWHTDLKIADAGMLSNGASLQDTYAALRMVVGELTNAGKKVIVFGGSHDLTLGLYQGIAQEQKVFEVTVVDALINLDRESIFANDNFLYELITSQPNFVRHLNLLGFQSYFVNPDLLETIDKLRFDCVRVGKAQEYLGELEPGIRSSALFSFDLCALAHAYAPAIHLSPNGFTGQEACKLMQYAGMSRTNKVSGIFGFGQNDESGLTAMQVAHMIWYSLDGMQQSLHEAPLSERSAFIEYHTICSEVDTLFLQSRYTGRWWMEMPNGKMLPCTYNDYLVASQNELPERWLRAQERLV